MKYLIIHFDNIYKVNRAPNIITREKLQKHSLKWEKPIVISEYEFDEIIDSKFSEVYKYDE